LAALWHGDALASFRYHPLGLLIFGVCALLLLYALCPPGWNRARGLFQRAVQAAFSPRTMTVVAALLIGIWLVRVGFALCGSGFFLW
jgi:hypothetical protein